MSTEAEGHSALGSTRHGLGWFGVPPLLPSFMAVSLVWAHPPGASPDGPPPYQPRRAPEPVRKGQITQTGPPQLTDTELLYQLLQCFGGVLSADLVIPLGCSLSSESGIIPPEPNTWEMGVGPS